MNTHSQYIQASGIILARSRDEHAETLFRPVNGKTADGYIIRKNKNGIRLWFMGETYTLNPHHVFCLETKLENGKTWYSYGGKLNKLSMWQLADLEDAIRAALS